VKKGYLSEYFTGAAAKVLSMVEADTLTSNQHEFNGVEGLRKILGEPKGRVRYEAKFMYLNDQDDDPVVEEGFLTWYDARQKARVEKGVMRYEYRLYFPTNRVSENANAGDILIIARDINDQLFSIVAEKDTTIASQLMWLFGFPDLEGGGFSIRKGLESEKYRLELTSELILESLGFALEAKETNWLEKMISNFGNNFPTTREFSEFARKTIPDVSVLDGPDEALMVWLEREEKLFREFEKHLIGSRLSEGFDGDVDGFISFSLSVQNRRKSRAGLAIENHLEKIFQDMGIRYTRAPVTENKTKPDFIFPGIEEYRESPSQENQLTMLGVKASCKDRWRQVIPEAQKIQQKHLFTIEAAISTNQTDEMVAHHVRLVLPDKLHRSFTPEQTEWLLSLDSFIGIVKERQKTFASRSY